jgi:hypothetical protein
MTDRQCCAMQRGTAMTQGKPVLQSLQVQQHLLAMLCAHVMGAHVALGLSQPCLVGQPASTHLYSGLPHSCPVSLKASGGTPDTSSGAHVCSFSSNRCLRCEAPTNRQELVHNDSHVVDTAMR